MSVENTTSTMQYLTLTLDDDLFAVNISKVREVVDFDNIRKIPRTPEFMLGVINLRSNVVPVIDMRLKFGLSKTVKQENTSIVIMEVTIANETTVLGALVDSVQAVIDLEPEQIDPPPKLGTRLKTEFIHGMGKVDGQFIVVLDIDKVFTSEDIIIDETANQASTVKDTENNVST